MVVLGGKGMTNCVLKLASLRYGGNESKLAPASRTKYERIFAICNLQPVRYRRHEHLIIFKSYIFIRRFYIFERRYEPQCNHRQLSLRPTPRRKTSPGKTESVRIPNSFDREMASRPFYGGLHAHQVSMNSNFLKLSFFFI